MSMFGRAENAPSMNTPGAHRIVMSDAAEMAEDVIHPTMHRGHSNVCESRLNVVTKYRSKNKAIEKSAYEFFTNMGLIQGNMAWAYDAYGPDYHWMIDLLERMKLSVNMPLVRRLLRVQREVCSLEWRERVRQARSTASPVNKRGIRNKKSGSDGPATGRSQCLMGRLIDAIGFVIMYI